jgi:hypothetical protein
LNLGDIFSQQADKEAAPKFDENWLLPILTEQMEADSRKQVQETKWRASSIGGCPRYLMYQRKGYDDNKDAKSLITLFIGTQVHEFLQGFLQKTGLLKSLEEKVRVIDINDAEGSYDGLLSHPDGEELLEIKTMNVEAYQRQLLYRKIYPKYIFQANFYMLALGVKRARFVFVNKNGLFTQEFEKEHKGEGLNPLWFEQILYADPKIQQAIRDRVIELDSHLVNETMPERKTVSQCSYCPVADRCKAESKLEKAAKKAADKTSKLND